ncbi:HlyD family secretion protein [Thiocapsa sp. UBA6158]|jgi:HlyD family secretion protein|uniref:HlyD family secretion protein n=1 Tax=Thiocapsa sp. UBA6158 TaxID=1947692 RepID=UPI0025D10CA3|nr:HlyD family efflux transporter periplasmic adaptor subunit [Thiocapsa sp. UBA6158]
MRRVLPILIALLLAGCFDDAPPRVLGTLERDRVALSATSAEVIVALPVAEGTPVTKGALLVQLEDLQQRAEVDRARAQVARAEANLQRLRHGPRVQEIAAARAQVAGREADLREAQITYDRNHELIARKAVSQADVDRAELTIVATRDGTLDNLPWNLGERVTVGSPVAILLAGDAPYARVHVPEPYRVKIAKGAQLKVHVDGIDQPFDGTVRWISSAPAFTPYYALNASDRARLMYLAKVELPQSAAALPNGVPAQVEMP